MPYRRRTLSELLRDGRFKNPGNCSTLHTWALEDLMIRRIHDLRYNRREAPRQAPRVPSRILQEETHPVNVQLCWHVGQIKSSMGGASSPTHAQWYTPLHFSQYMPSSSSTPHTRHASGLESSKYSAIGSGTTSLTVYLLCHRSNTLTTHDTARVALLLRRVNSYRNYNPS